MRGFQAAGILFVAGLASIVGAVYVLAGTGWALLAAGISMVAVAVIWAAGLNNGR